MKIAENLRTSLDKNFCVILPKNSSIVYLFWKLSDFKIEKFIKREYSDRLIVKVFDSFDNYIMEISEVWYKGKIYINLPQDNFRCYIKIYAQSISGNIEEIACSNFIDIPMYKEYNLNYGNYKFILKV